MGLAISISLTLYLSWSKVVIGTKRYGILVAEYGKNEFEVAGGDIPRRKNSENFEEIERMATSDGRTIYAIAGDFIIKSTNCGKRWFKVHKLPHGVIFSPKDDSTVKIRRNITSLSVWKSRFLSFTTPYSVYISSNGGKTFARLPKNPLTYSDFYLSSFYDGKQVIVGTSYNGLFLYRGGEWKQIKGPISYPYNEGSYFYEEIIGIGKTRYGITAMQNFSDKIHLIKNERAEELLKAELPIQFIKQVSFSKDRAFISCHNGFYEINIATSQVKKLNLKMKLPPFIYPTTIMLSDNSGTTAVFMKREMHTKRFFPVSKKVKRKRAIYTGIPHRNIKRYKKLIDEMKKIGLNAVVIDVKDDFGNLRYKSKIKMAMEANALKPAGNLKKIVEMFHKNGIYVIARIVSFKDKKMFFYDNGKFTIIDKKTGKPWKGLEKEFWVDPYCRAYHHYLLEVAKEVQSLGFDEIQFDYIRFPTDGPVWRAKYTHRPSRLMKKADAIFSFLLLVKKHIKIPVSIDVYGFNGWFEMGTRMGQNTTRFADVVDVICPMLYPSHFGKKFLSEKGNIERAYRIVFTGTYRLKQKLPKNEIRSYIQAFRWGSPSFGKDYIMAELKGIKDAETMSFTFWNPAGKYENVFKWLETSRENLWW